MEGKDKGLDPLPDSFQTEEEAGAFWDSHSAGDYEENLEPVEEVIEIQDRVFGVQIAEDVFQKTLEGSFSLAAVSSKSGRPDSAQTITVTIENET
jgi:hypothetical protein